MDRLQDDLERGIRWFDSRGEAVAFVSAGGLEDSYLSAELVSAFVQSAGTIVVSEGTVRKAVQP